MHFQRRTKIISTLGPATDSLEVIKELIEAGVNLVRLNFSHGTHEEHKKRMDLVRQAAKELNATVGILADMQGPKIRVASFKDGPIELAEGDTFILDADLAEHDGNQQMVGVGYKDLPKDVKAGDTLLLCDGRMVFTVDKVEGNKIYNTVVVGGPLSDHKGINRKGGGLSAKALTEKDIKDMHYALSQDVDYIAISFPRSAEDMLEAREIIAKDGKKAGVIAKIERIEAMQNIDEIIEASDAVMVARGDLAIEIGDAEVPVAQKLIIHKARCLDKAVITATQMMESMLTRTVPTRAEVSDVANAVLDYTDAVMLSEETAMGKHPALVVKTMSEVCEVAERQPEAYTSGHRMSERFHRVDEAVAMATMYVANHMDIEAIICLTESGHTPLWMSRIRTAIPIYGMTRNEGSLGKMTLYRGVYPMSFDLASYTRSDVNAAAVEVLLQHGTVKKGDRIILTKGDTMGVGGGSNVMKILVAGEVA